MKVIRAAFVLFAAFALVSCASLARDALSGAVGALGGSMASGAASAASAPAAQAAAEFQSGEILCSADSGPMAEAYYRVARVVTPASASTKNQAEVIFISDGSKSWVNYVVNSRKATKADIAIGAPVLYLNGWAEHDSISAESYRKDYWAIGNVTSTEYLYKNQVEIAGNLYYLDFMRVPTDPVK